MIYPRCPEWGIDLQFQSFEFQSSPTCSPLSAPRAAHLCTAVAMATQSLFVIAIDFGTSYSGYCFSLASGTDQICQVYWGTEHRFKTPKTPTSILFNWKQEFKYLAMML
uniref:Heat shock protein family A (Hsp70) member 12A n=1 Tax=Ficedula albicollis TaxID=59894 RepID=A0A803W321_FICAL